MFFHTLAVFMEHHQAILRMWALAKLTQGRYLGGHVACGPGDGVGLEGTPKRASLLTCILVPQMVVVNSSSPTAACSGSWETRGMEESVPTTDGSAESLYVQGLARTLTQGLGVG